LAGSLSGCCTGWESGPSRVTFFLAVGWLTLNLSTLSAIAALVTFSRTRRRAGPLEMLRLPRSLSRVEDYFRWLTPVVFIVGIIFGHFFWH
jgi:hypothetical protein